MRLTASIGCSWAVLLAAGAAADTKTFDNDDGDYNWFADANWDPDGVPGLGDVALVDADDVVLAVDFMPLEANRLEISSGLRLSSSSSLYVTGNSVITGLDFIGPNPTDFVADGPLAIGGLCTFQGSPVFRGADVTTIGGTFVTFEDGFFVDDNARLVLASPAILFEDGIAVRAARVEAGAECRVTGVVTTQTGSITTIGDGQWIIDGGVLRYSPTSALPSSLTGNLLMTNGRLESTLGEWRVSAHNIQGGTIDTDIDGNFEFTNFDRELKAARYEGAGAIFVTGGSIGGNPIEAMSDGGVLFLQGGGVTLTTDILNSGSMTVFNSELFGPGAVQNSGVLRLSGAEVKTRIDVLGQTISIGTVDCGALIDVLPGGRFSLEGSIEPPFGETPGRVRVGGEFVVDSVPTGSIRVPLDLADGLVKVSGATLNIRDGGDWSGGQIDLDIDNNTARVILFGGGGDITVSGDVEVFDSSSDPFPDEVSAFNWGVASGPQPTVQIDGGASLSFDLDSGTVLMRASEVTGSGSIEIETGTLFEISRTASIEPVIINRGNLRINSLTTAFDIDNRASVTQRNTIRIMEDGGFLNSGTWTTDGAARLDYDLLSPEGDTAEFENVGTVIIPSSSSLTANVRFTNGGTVLADGGTATFNNTLIETQTPDGQTALAIAGRWIARNGGRIFFEQGVSLIGVPGANPIERNRVEADDEDAVTWIDGVRRGYDTDLQLDDVTFNEPIVALTRCSLTIPENGNVACNDYRWYDSDLDMGPGSTMTCTGSAVFESCEDSCTGDTPSSSATLEPGATLEAQGGVRVGGQQSVIDDITGVLQIARFGEPPVPPAIITPLLDLYAILRPSQGEFGSMTIDGDLLMRDSARVEVKVGAAQADRLDVTGQATLAGTLGITLAPDYTPAIGDEVIAMTAAGGFTGAVDAVDAPTDTGVRWRAHTVGTELRLIAACPADLVAPFGTLDLGDISAFVAGFLAGDPIADLDGNGLYDLTDIAAFVALFSGGC